MTVRNLCHVLYSIDKEICVIYAEYTYSWVGIQSDIRDERDRTEPDIGTSDIGLKRMESDIASFIRLYVSPISDILHLRNSKTARKGSQRRTQQPS